MNMFLQSLSHLKIFHSIEIDFHKNESLISFMIILKSVMNSLALLHFKNHSN